MYQIDIENQTLNEDVLFLEGLKVSSWTSIPIFIILLFIYIFAVVSNVSLVSLIVSRRSLHQPMYLLFCNMSINDIFGTTIVTPHVLRDIFIPPTQRYINYIDCVAQAFCVHLYASASHTILMIMAFDRYNAICNPLRYATIMTNRMVILLSVWAWATALVMVSILLGLTIRLSRCRRFIPSPFCDNASLFNLSCESVLVNDIFGAAYTVLVLGSSLIFITITYLKICTVVLRGKNKAVNSKALQTCTTHLAVYVFLFASISIIVAMHRFPNLSEHRKVVIVLCEVCLPAFNAVIYGLQIKEIKQTIVALFCSRKVAQMK